MRFNILYMFIAIVGATGFKTVESSEIALARIYFEKASTSESAAKSLKAITDAKTNDVLKAYNGAALAILAKYAWSPYKKLDNVNKGLALLNSAVKSSSSDVEIRFLRFAIEENLPAIISATRHLQEDKTFILKNLVKTHPNYKSIKNYLILSKSLSATEKKALN
ncbi:MAG: hypothetical protein V4613_06890 [Bacteroidota bacterium]